jgi:hypothetical protein
MRHRTRRSDTRSTAAAALILFGIAAVAVSFFLEAEGQRLREYAATVRPARAILRSTEVKRWIPTRDNWSAFGAFDIVAGDHQGVAEGSLIPASYHRTRPRRYQMPEAEAARFLDGWVVGRTYDGYWNPEQPSGVFFDKVPVEANATTILALRIAAPFLIVGGVLLAYRRRATAGALLATLLPVSSALAATPPPLGELEGQYEYHEGTTLFIVADGDRVVAILGDGKYPLRATGIDTFVNGVGDTIPFVRDGAGRIMVGRARSARMASRRSIACGRQAVAGVRAGGSLRPSRNAADGVEVGLRPRPLAAQRVRPGPPAAARHVEARDSHPAARGVVGPAHPTGFVDRGRRGHADAGG